MSTYNGLIIPNHIHSNRIVSAFENMIDDDSLDYYRNEVNFDDVSPIKGYPSIIDEDDVESDMYFISGEPITHEHIGERIWYVTDGHHRSIIANEIGILLPVELDDSCIVDTPSIEKKKKKSISPKL